MARFFGAWRFAGGTARTYGTVDITTGFAFTFWRRLEDSKTRRLQHSSGCERETSETLAKAVEMFFEAFELFFEAVEQLFEALESELEALKSEPEAYFCPPRP